MKQFIVLAALVAVASAQAPPQLRAITRIASPSGNIQGNITFTQLPEGSVHVDGVILGLPQGFYGFHVHEKGDITGGCLSTGSHFNPENKLHGHPNDTERHVGDLGNVQFDASSVARVDIMDKKIALAGPYSILGRAVVLHEKDDDFGRGDNADSRKTGNAGGRVACGVIGILDPVEGWDKSSGHPTSLASGLLLFVLVSFFYVF